MLPTDIPRALTPTGKHAGGTPRRNANVVYLFSVGIRVFDNLKEQRITTETQRHRDEFQEDYSVLLLCVTVSLW